MEARAFLSSNIVLANTGDRVVGYDALAESFIEWKYPIEESVREVLVERDVAVVVLEREALGYAADSGIFVPIPFERREELVSVTATSKAVAVITSERILSFSSSKKRWEMESVPNDR